MFGHGSTVESANDAVRAMAAELQKRQGYEAVQTAFLEAGRPDLSGAIDRLAQAGVEHVIVIPYFLTLGMVAAVCGYLFVRFRRAGWI